MTSTKHEKYDKSKSFRWACATLYNNINDCLSCIQVWCIEGNPTTRRIKVDSSYPGHGLLSCDWDDSKQSGHYESAIKEVLSRCACTNLKNIPTHTMGWNIMQRRIIVLLGFLHVFLYNCFMHKSLIIKKSTIMTYTHSNTAARKSLSFFVTVLLLNEKKFWLLYLNLCTS